MWLQGATAMMHDCMASTTVAEIEINPLSFPMRVE